MDSGLWESQIKPDDFLAVRYDGTERQAGKGQHLGQGSCCPLQDLRQGCCSDEGRERIKRHRELVFKRQARVSYHSMLVFEKIVAFFQKVTILWE